MFIIHYILKIAMTQVVLLKGVQWKKNHVTLSTFLKSLDNLLEKDVFWKKLITAENLQSIFIELYVKIFQRYENNVRIKELNSCKKLRLRLAKRGCPQSHKQTQLARTLSICNTRKIMKIKSSLSKLRISLERHRESYNNDSDF